MSEIAIKVEHLGKRYKIGKQRVRYKSLRESLVSALSVPLRRLQGQSDKEDTIWALQDVSFEIKQGEVVGIIGRNGAGKSTLLKILSRITKPTTGRAEIYGRVGSLLEVGTGFHPELTGRENIYLNGAILGMTRREIDRKFDEIVAFSEMEQFLDTPVKHYSSGMYVRLAFAVAAHLEPEILVVDEVLAVGDAQFQKKCLGKMGDVAQSGRTVLFVSHNMAAIQRLCEYSIWLDNGRIMMFGNTPHVLDSYLSKIGIEATNAYLGNVPRSNPVFGNRARLIECYTVNEHGERIALFKFGEALKVVIGLEALDDLSDISFTLGIDSSLDYRLTTVLSEDAGAIFSVRKGEKILVTIDFPSLRLKPGRYFLTPGVRQNKRSLDMINKANFFDIQDVTTDGKIQEPHIRGDLFFDAQWSIIA